MPYTQEELDSGNVEFYTNFRSELRGKYLDKITKSAEQNFRDENNVLYSYEDILTGDGIEDVNLDVFAPIRVRISSVRDPNTRHRPQLL